MSRPDQQTSVWWSAAVLKMRVGLGSDGTWWRGHLSEVQRPLIKAQCGLSPV